MITTGRELCPYFGEKEREQWHRERGLDDPQKEKEVYRNRIDQNIGNPGVAGPEKPIDLGDKHARYRARKKAELAEKARLRRAQKA